MTRTTIFLSALVMLAAGCTAPSISSPSSSNNGVQNPVVSPTSAPISTSGSLATSQPTSQSAAAPITGGEIRYVLVPDQSEARYKVREQLANHDLPNDAVGKTKSVSGQIVLKSDGSVDPVNSKFVVDVSSLATDQGMRDNFVRRNILQTSQYPQAVFVPTEITGLPSPLPQNGDVNFQVKGNLTIKDVTKPVTWNVTGKVQNGQAAGTASTSFTFEQFNLEQPRVPVVLSVVDNITLEVDLTLKPAS